MTEIEIAYIAGLMDGEAYIGIKRDKAYKCQQRVTPGYHARIQIRMVDKEAIEFIANSFGGHYYKENPRSNNSRPLYCWSSSDLQAENILRLIIPYLRVKKQVAQYVLDLRDMQKDAIKHKTKVIGSRSFKGVHGQTITVKTKCLSDEFVFACDALWNKCSNFNHGIE